MDLFLLKHDESQAILADANQREYASRRPYIAARLKKAIFLQSAHARAMRNVGRNLGGLRKHEIDLYLREGGGALPTYMGRMYSTRMLLLASGFIRGRRYRSIEQYTKMDERGGPLTTYEIGRLTDTLWEFVCRKNVATAHGMLTTVGYTCIPSKNADYMKKMIALSLREWFKEPSSRSALKRTQGST